MNRSRRNRICIIIDKILDLVNELMYIKEEEDDTRENIPINFENSEIYENSENCSDALDDAISDISDSLDKLKEEIS